MRRVGATRCVAVERLLPAILLLGLFALAPHPSSASVFLVILDHSGSMGSAASMEPAKEALRQAMDELSTPGARWGLRVYGTGCCSPDTRLLVPVSEDGEERIAAILPSVRGIASSPMPAALRAARTGELVVEGLGGWTSRRHVIVVSDGVVDREGACREARLLREDGVRVTIIGLEVASTHEGAETLRHVASHPRCAAGTYVRVERPDLLARALVDWSRAVFGLPFRLLALLLALVSGYHTTKFSELALERNTWLGTRLRRESIPRLCRAFYVFWIALSFAIFFSVPLWLWLLFGVLPGSLSLFLRHGGGPISSPEHPPTHRGDTP